MALKSRGPIKIYPGAWLQHCKTPMTKWKIAIWIGKTEPFQEKKKKKLFIAFFFRDGFSSRAVSAVKSLKLFQSWGTSHGYYPSPPWCMPLPSFDRMAFSGLIKARKATNQRGKNTKNGGEGQTDEKNREAEKKNRGNRGFFLERRTNK